MLPLLILGLLIVAAFFYLGHDQAEWLVLEARRRRARRRRRREVLRRRADRSAASSSASRARLRNIRRAARDTGKPPGGFPYVAGRKQAQPIWKPGRRR